MDEGWRQVLCQPADEAAPLLLGARLMTGDGVAVRLVEVEAYGGAADPASHAYGGPTNRNAPMFGPPGHLYVYLSYGIHLCVNVVAHVPGSASAVLLRAASVAAGEDVVRLRRGWAGPARDLAAGPGRLGRALGVTLSDSGADLFGPDAPLRFAEPPTPLPTSTVSCGPRVGISRAVDVPWRFWIEGDPAVSRARPPRRP